MLNCIEIVGRCRKKGGKFIIIIIIIIIITAIGLSFSGSSFNIRTDKTNKKIFTNINETV